MKKSQSEYICQQCDYRQSKWAGQCPSCEAWNSFVETLIDDRPAGFGGQFKINSDLVPAKILSLKNIESSIIKRQTSSLSELDRVLGGGIVPGSLTLVAGAPGVGKSSLLTSVVANLKGLYVLGEESAQQVKLRVDRMGLSSDFDFLSETQIDKIIPAIQNQTLVVVDSIQTIWTQRLVGVAGSVGQVRECSQQLLQRSKETGVPIFLVGHITKEGSVAGPKVLEHLVDTVLQFEGDSGHEYRLLRAVKNRFGPTDEVGVFTMQEQGLMEVHNPSELFLQDHGGNPPPGSITIVSMQGLRPVLVEIQALVNHSGLAMPRRVATGISERRLQVLCAVLQKHVGLNLSEKDVFVNVAGGLNLKEPAADLGVCLAIASSYKNKSVSKGTVAIGEVGLLGELRKVGFLDRRVKEAKTQGFSKVIDSTQFRYLKEVVNKFL